MSSTQTFIRDLDRFADRLEIDIHTLVRHVSLFVFKGVVMKSPVDTGRFRASWNIGVNTIDNSVMPEIKAVITSGVKSMERSNAKAVATRKALAKTKVLAQVRDNYPAVYITNNLPYAKRLEDGHSEKQAPNGMVRLTMLEAQEYLKGMIR